jgi:hypothetical protein
MANMTVTNVDIGPALIDGKVFETSVLTVGGAVTVLEGTILARDSVSLKFVPFVIGGTTNENGIPKAILTYDVEAAGAGDVGIRALVDGIYRTERLIVDADGDDSNITDAILDQLRDYNITAQNVTDISELDNQ